MKTGRETPEEVGLARQQLQTVEEGKGEEERTHAIAYPTIFLQAACYCHREGHGLHHAEAPCGTLHTTSIELPVYKQHAYHII